jgi:hypothetical protein
VPTHLQTHTGPENPIASTLRALAGAPQYAFMAKSPIGAACYVGRAKLALVKDERSAGINPATLEGGEMATAETLAPMWPIATRHAATTVSGREPAGAISLHCAPRGYLAFDAEKQRKQDLPCPQSVVRFCSSPYPAHLE